MFAMDQYLMNKTGQISMDQTQRTPLFAISLILISIAVVIPSPVAATPQCCEPVSQTWHLIGAAEGDSTKGSMSPFSTDLGDEHRATIEPVDLGGVGNNEQVVAVWESTIPSDAEIPEDSWNISLLLEISDANALFINASVEIEFSGKAFSSQTNTPTSYPLGTHQLDFEVDIEKTTISAGTPIKVTFSVRSATFQLAGQGAKAELVWGTETFDSFVITTLPVAWIEIEEPAVRDSEIDVPVVIGSEIAERMIAVGTTSIQIDGENPVSTTPITEPADELVRLTYSIPRGAAANGSTIKITFTLDVPSLDRPAMEATRTVTINESGSSDDGLGWYYPEREPGRMGDNQLDGDMKVVVVTDEEGRLDRSIHLEFQGPVALWMRWGLDNLGTDNLTTNSYWKGIDGTAISSSERERGYVDPIEISRLEAHLAAGQNLHRFLSTGLGLDSEALLGAQRIDLPTLSARVELLTNNEVRADRGIVMKIYSSQPIPSETFLLLKDPLKGDGAELWRGAKIEGSFETSGFWMVKEIVAQDLDPLHRRGIRLESISYEVDLLQVSGYSIEMQLEHGMSSTPALVLIESGCLLISLIGSLVIGRRKGGIAALIAAVPFAGSIGIAHRYSMPSSVIIGACLLMFITLSIISRTFSEREGDQGS